MAKYILRREQRENVLDGIRVEKRGELEVRVLVPVSFKHGKVVDSDLDLSSWVNAGVIVEVQGAPAPAPKPAPAPEPEPEAPSEPEEAPAAEIDVEPSKGYAEVDGQFVCDTCGKKYKSEEKIADHVAKH